MKHYHKNPRQITKKQKDDLFKWMDEFGDLGCIVINVRTDEELIGGNQRSDYPGIMSGLIQPVITQRFEQPTPQGTIMEGYYEIKGERFKVRWVDWDDKKAERANLIANKAGGTFDMDILANQFDLPVLLDSGFEERELIGFDFGEPKDAEPQTDRAAELLEKWQVKTGDLWQIGEHRLICGDSTKAEDYKTLLQGETASMCFTSPPYNQGGKAKRLPAFYKGEGDNKTKDEYFDFLISVLECLNTNMTPDAPLLWNVSYNSQSRDDYGRIVFSSSNPFHVMETIIWDKKHGFNISARGILSRDSELIFLMCSGEDYYTNQGRYDTWYNTWRIGTQGAQTEGHGAAYPVELVEKGISLFSPVDGVIIEPFCGTGSNLVACQNLSRRGRAVEISPAYCSVTLERMSTAFPELEIVRIENDPQD